MALYCRQVISRSDLRCSALLPPLLPLPFVQLVTVSRSPSSEETLRDDWWKARGPPLLPSPPPHTHRPVQACLWRLLFFSFFHPCNFSASSFVCQTRGLYQWERPRRPQVCLKNKRGGGGFARAVPGDAGMNALLTHVHAPSMLSVAQTACVCCQKTD